MNTRPTWQRWLVRGVILVLAVALIAGATVVYYAVSTAIRAENTLHATTAALFLLEEFVQQNRRWPRSWEELKEIPLEASNYRGRFSWADLKERVSIDFDADLRVMGTQDPMEFKAIEPIGPNYGTYGHALTKLQHTARELTADESSAGDDVD